MLLNSLSPGEYKRRRTYFTSPGNWRVDMTMRRTDGDDVAQAFVLPVARCRRPRPPPAAARFELPFTVFNWNEVVGAAAGVRRRADPGLPAQFVIARVGYRAIVTGATCCCLPAPCWRSACTRIRRRSATSTNGNPVPPNADSVARGKELFQQNCVSVTASTAAATARLPPASAQRRRDFRLHMPLHTDPQFYAFIHDGYAGTAMPQFGSALSETDIWNLVNYLRSAFSGGVSQ